MDKNYFKQLIAEVLKQDDRLWNEDKTELNQTLLLDLVEKIDEKVIDLLLQEKGLREKFFVKINPPRTAEQSTPQEGNYPPLTPQEGNFYYVFKTNDFRFFMEENKVDNSYTTYKNKIGLTDGKKFLKDTNDVVLDFPYKDCVLEGGQSTEEGIDTYFEKNPLLRGGTKGDGVDSYIQKQGKRKEIFFNQVLAYDEIDRLFDPKALINWKRFTKDGEIPLFEGWTAKQDGVDNSPFEGWTAKQDGVDNSPFEESGVDNSLFEESGVDNSPLEESGVDNIPAWQKKSLFPYWSLPKNKELNQKAKELRKQGVLSEVLFWESFKDKEKIKGYDIDRQVIIGNFIVDFFIAELGLVVEIDGSSHDNKQEYDNERQAFLEELNLQVVRYADSEVKKNIDGIHKDFLRNIEIREEELRRIHPVSPVGLPPLKKELSTPSNAKHLPPLKRGIDGTIKENLIIKGNNLLVLHSLKKQFAGKVKLIYIDPPYNTGNDGFKYNDNFNHSTWLTFMKNRLEVARELLRDDGVIFVQIDNSPSDLEESPELGYLLVLMDEVFHRKNYIGIQVWKKKGNASNTESNIGTITESILMYAKNFNSISFNLQDYKRNYKYEDNGIFYNLEKPVKTNSGTYERTTMLFGIETKEGVFYPPEGKRWTIGEETAKEYVKNNKYKIVDNEFYIKKFTEDYKKGEFKLHNNLLEQHGSLKSAKDELENLGFNRENFDSPKPEKLIQRIIEISTQPNDIVLDYHLGSGTTCAVAHKMGRRYIGIEQMDYVETIACERLKKVIGKSTSPAKAGTPQEENIPLVEGWQTKSDGVDSFDTGGISKSVNWQGGGDFIYFELAKWNETAKEQILACESLEELIKFFDILYAKYFLNYNLKIKEFREKVINEEEFKNLSLEEQKKMFVAMLDNNQMYVNKTEMTDTKYGISKENQRLTEEFYNNCEL